MSTAGKPRSAKGLLGWLVALPLMLEAALLNEWVAGPALGFTGNVWVRTLDVALLGLAALLLLFRRSPAMAFAERLLLERRPSSGAALFGLLLLMVLVTAIETGFGALNRVKAAGQPSVERKISEEMYQHDPILSSRFPANATIEHSILSDGETVYDVTYRSDTFRRRVTPAPISGGGGAS